MMKRVSEALSLLGSTAKGCVKIALQSRRTIAPAKAAGNTLVVLANGPSLRQTVDSCGAALASMVTLAVNFFANTPEFRQLKPRYYVLADPHFFRATGQENVDALWRNLAAADWDMTLSVPARNLADARRRLGPGARARLATFNFVGVEGFGGFERLVYSRGLAMPRPRNVLVPAVMVGIQAGFTDIYLTGTDHSWLETIRVTDRNEVVSVQPHFYADSGAEQRRVVSEYTGYRLHDILYSFYVAFSSYHRLRRFADSRRINIYNATPDSYIDAFPRRALPCCAGE